MSRGTQIAVRLRPRGRGDELLGLREGVLQVRVSAPPLDGKANRSLCRLIAKRLRIAPSRVRIVRGQKSRDKIIWVDGIDAVTLRKTLED